MAVPPELAHLASQLESSDLAGNPTVLTPTSVVEYFKGLSPPEGVDWPVLPSSASLSADDSSTGNLNYCFVIKDTVTGGSIFVKQAPDFIKCLGEDAKLTTERIRFEARAALEFMKFAPGSVPFIYHFDPLNCVMVMEHLASHRLLNDALIDGQVTVESAESISDFMAKVHVGTHASLISEELKNEYLTRFYNPTLVNITVTYVFTLPFKEDPSNSHTPGLDERVQAMRADDGFLEDVKAALATYESRKEALIHGDLHAGSIMSDGNESKVIDHEFVFYGPAGFDLGLFMAGYIFPYAAAAAKGDAELVQRIRAALEASVNRYLGNIAKSLGPEVVAQIFQDSLGFSACELMRRVLGVAKRRDLEGIEDIPTKLKAENIVLDVGQAFVAAFNGKNPIPDAAAAIQTLEAAKQKHSP